MAHFDTSRKGVMFPISDMAGNVVRSLIYATPFGNRQACYAGMSHPRVTNHTTATKHTLCEYVGGGILA